MEDKFLMKLLYETTCEQCDVNQAQNSGKLKDKCKFNRRSTDASSHLLRASFLPENISSQLPQPSLGGFQCPRCDPATISTGFM